VPNGRYVAVGDLAVIRDNRSVLGAGWIDSIEATPGRKIRYRCPNCTSTDFKYRIKKQFAHRCAKCITEFDAPAESRLYCDTGNCDNRQHVAAYRARHATLIQLRRGVWRALTRVAGRGSRRR
jgi:hypothetical protein